MARTRRRHLSPHEHRKTRHSEVTRTRSILALAEHHAHLPKCPGTGKVRYSRQREAAQALGVQTRLNHHEGPSSVYRCPECGDWHLSSWAPGTYKRARRGLDGP